VSLLRPSIATALIVASARAVRDGTADPIDARIREQVAALRTPERDAFVRVATDLGSMYGVGVVAGALALAGRSRLAVRVGFAGATAWTLAQGAKPLLPRERPYQADGAERLVVEPSGTSWPSGHAAVAAAMASTLGQGRGVLTRATLSAVAAAVGLSRVYVGVHHASDVVAGAGIGELSARLVRLLSRR
jgi:membrane-associated phospholipid phosphatase